MSVVHFKPEIWSAVLLEAEKKALVLANLCNRDYEGEVSEAGESVRITSVGRPTVNSYTGTVTYEDVDDASQLLPLDQKKYIAFKVQDVDRAQAKGNFWTASMEEGAYQLADGKDQLVAGMYTQSGNVITTTAITSADLAYTGLVTIAEKLDNANVPNFGRWCVIPPWYKSKLLEKAAIIDTSAYGSSEPILNGYIGRVAGLDLYVSNNIVNHTGDDYSVMAGTKRAITFADQLVGHMEAGRAESFIGDWIRSLHVYGAKVVKADGLVVLQASKT